MERSIIGIAENLEQAEQVLVRLQQLGFLMSELSLLHQGEATNPRENSPRSVFGLLDSLGAVGIPSLGPVIASGPLMASLAGAAAEHEDASVEKSLAHLGLTAEQSAYYENSVCAGSVLVAARADSQRDEQMAKNIMTELSLQSVVVSQIDAAAVERLHLEMAH